MTSQLQLFNIIVICIKKIFINYKIEYRIKTALFSHNVIFFIVNLISQLTWSKWFSMWSSACTSLFMYSLELSVGFYKAYNLRTWCRLLKACFKLQPYWTFSFVTNLIGILHHVQHLFYDSHFPVDELPHSLAHRSVALRESRHVWDSDSDGCHTSSSPRTSKSFD